MDWIIASAAYAFNPHEIEMQNGQYVTIKNLEAGIPGIYLIGDCAGVEGHVLPYALAAILAGEAAAVSYPAMPVLVKTKAYPLAVLPPAIGAPGEWRIEMADAGIRAMHTGSAGELNGFALGGSETGKRAELARQVAALQPKRLLQRRRRTASALLPRQAVKAPAIVGGALMVVVQLAFEAIQNVVNVGKAVLFQIFAGFFRTVAGAANQNHRPMVRGGHAHLAEEMRVQIPIDAFVPGNQNRADRMADKQEFKFRTAVDQHGISLIFKEGKCLFRGQVFQGGLLA